MQRIATALPAVFLLQPQIFGDARGFFMQTYAAREFATWGIERPFVQHNHSLSVKGTLRGLHYQLHNPQAKLCRVVRGEVWDVAVDIRADSPTFGQHAGTLLSAENKRQIYIPRGFAHGFLVISDEAEFLYQCDDYYAPGDEHGVLWNDPNLEIAWPLEQYGIERLLLSPKDEIAPRLGTVARADLPQFSAMLRAD